MHDAKGRELKVGDVVVIPCVITDLSATPDFCNINVTTVGGRRPDGTTNSLGYLNTKQVYRANPGDDTTIKTAISDGDGPDAKVITWLE